MYRVLKVLLVVLALAWPVTACNKCESIGRVEQTGTPALHTDIMLQVLEEKVPEVCGQQLAGRLWWYDSPLGPIENVCGIPAMGCAGPWGCDFAAWVSNRHPPSGPDVLPVWRTALAHEVGHWVWYNCHGWVGEWYDDAGKYHSDPEFDAWTRSVDDETMRRATSSGAP